MDHQHRFASAAELYVRHRPRYPQAFIAAVAAELGLDGRGRLLDLGCGPAFLAIGLRPFVAEAIAMDPEPAMLEAARAEVAAADVDVEIRQGSSATLGDELAPLRLVTMGRSFHWMEREATLHRLDQLVAPGGAVVLVNSRNPDHSANGWRRLPREIGDRFVPDPEHPSHAAGYRPHRAVLESSAFSRLATLSHEIERRVAIADVIGHALSKSSTAPARLGERRAAFETELAEALRPFSRDGLLDEVITFEALIARRP